MYVIFRNPLLPHLRKYGVAWTPSQNSTCQTVFGMFGIRYWMAAAMVLYLLITWLGFWMLKHHRIVTGACYMTPSCPRGMDLPFTKGQHINVSLTMRKCRTISFDIHFKCNCQLIIFILWNSAICVLRSASQRIAINEFLDSEKRHQNKRPFVLTFCFCADSSRPV